MHSILIATTNAGKLREVRAVLVGLNVELTTLADLPPLSEAIEDSDTFEGNARKKALHYAGLANCWTLADDSGLEVDALGMAPGVYSARYAGPGCSPLQNNQALIRALAGVPLEDRTARFRCALALAAPDRVIAESSGEVEGLIVDAPRGSNGFGYDPHFLVPKYSMTTAQMSPDQKNRISHRGKALSALRPALERLLAPCQNRPTGP